MKRHTDILEETAWNEIKSILLESEGVLAKLSGHYLNQETDRMSLAAEKVMLEKAFNDKQEEKERILDLYRCRLISSVDLEKQLAKIAGEEAYLKNRMDKLAFRVKEQDKLDDRLHKAEEVLTRLKEVLRGPIPWEVKRQVIELLVWEVRINTITEGSKRRTEATITFAFDKNMLSANCTGMGSCTRGGNG